MVARNRGGVNNAGLGGGTGGRNVLCTPAVTATCHDAVDPSSRVYLDWNAGAPLRPEVRAALVDLVQTMGPGNPSSIHGEGRAARSLVERARRQVAEAVGAFPLDVVWTSGGTEANALAILGTLGVASGPVDVAFDPLAHPSVLETLREAEARGRARLVRLPVASDGRIDLAQAEAVLARARPAFVTVSLASHELGVVQDTATLSTLARAAVPEAVVHVDAVAAFGKVPVDVAGTGADLMSLSSHKIGGPPGAGALVVRRGLRLDPPIRGGGQERGIRPGTEPVLAIAGFGIAAERGACELGETAERLARLHAHARAELSSLAGVRIHGAREASTHDTLLVECEGAEGQLVVMALDLEGFAVSRGAACSSGTATEVAALLATGHGKVAARQAIRVSFGPDTTTAELDAFARALERVLSRIRGAHARSEAAPAREVRP